MLKPRVIITLALVILISPVSGQQEPAVLLYDEPETWVECRAVQGLVVTPELSVPLMGYIVFHLTKLGGLDVTDDRVDEFLDVLAGALDACNAMEELESQPVADISEDIYVANCTEARELGLAPLERGQPGYREAMDRDGDGVACETGR